MGERVGGRAVDFPRVKGRLSRARAREAALTFTRVRFVPASDPPLTFGTPRTPSRKVCTTSTSSSSIVVVLLLVLLLPRVSLPPLPHPAALPPSIPLSCIVRLNDRVLTVYHRRCRLYLHSTSAACTPQRVNGAFTLPPSAT